MSKQEIKDLKKIIKKDVDLKLLLFFTTISLFSIFYFKNHDDFPYYHLSFIHNITINKVEFGLGNFDLAYNHVSSLFFFRFSFIFSLFVSCWRASVTLWWSRFVKSF